MKGLYSLAILLYLILLAVYSEGAQTASTSPPAVAGTGTPPEGSKTKAKTPENGEGQKESQENEWIDKQEEKIEEGWDKTKQFFKAAALSLAHNVKKLSIHGYKTVVYHNITQNAAKNVQTASVNLYHSAVNTYKNVSKGIESLSKRAQGVTAAANEENEEDKEENENTSGSEESSGESEGESPAEEENENANLPDINESVGQTIFNKVAGSLVNAL